MILLLLTMAFSVAPVWADETAVATTAVATTAVATTIALPDLEQFVDETINAQLREMNVPGAAVAVVANGELVLVKGYGQANLAQNQPVGGERALFRTGSVGKLIAWTAVAFLLGLLFFLVAFANGVGDIDPAFGVPRLFFGEAGGLTLVLALPWLAAATAVGLAVSAVLVWRETAVALWGKLHPILLSLLALALVWWLAYWGLLG